MDLARNEFKRALAQRRVRRGIWSSLCSNIVADVLASVGFDWVLVDMEHAPNELASVLVQLQVYAGTSTEPVVRPPWNDPVVIKRLLDLGSRTLLIPMVQSPEEAEQAVRACRYPPHGIRGVSLSQRANRFGGVADYGLRAAEETCVLVQVETRAALARAGEIAAVDGVDGVFFGPADISADLGFMGQPSHESVLEAIREGARRANEAGKPAGILTSGAESAVRWIEEGFTFVAAGSDLNLMASAARDLLADLIASPPKRE